MNAEICVRSCAFFFLKKEEMETTVARVFFAFVSTDTNVSCDKIYQYFI